MKQILCLLLSLYAFESFAVTETKISIEEIFTPKGFDSNDSSEIIISGKLPDLCHKSPKAKLTMKDNKVFISVTALKTKTYCPKVVVPFIERVNLGMLKQGTYEIVVNEKTRFQKESSMKVDLAPQEEIDDHIYANVYYVETDAFSEKFDGKREVSLKGYNPSDCFVLDKVKFVSNKKNTYSVLPIMKKISDFCPMKMTPFSYKVLVPKLLDKEEVLLHVRIMNGKSVNRIFNN